MQEVEAAFFQTQTDLVRRGARSGACSSNLATSPWPQGLTKESILQAITQAQQGLRMGKEPAPSLTTLCERSNMRSHRAPWQRSNEVFILCFDDFNIWIKRFVMDRSLGHATGSALDSTHNMCAVCAVGQAIHDRDRRTLSAVEEVEWDREVVERSKWVYASVSQSASYTNDFVHMTELITQAWCGLTYEDVPVVCLIHLTFAQYSGVRADLRMTEFIPGSPTTQDVLMIGHYQGSANGGHFVPLWDSSGRAKISKQEVLTAAGSTNPGQVSPLVDQGCAFPLATYADPLITPMTIDHADSVFLFSLALMPAMHPDLLWGELSATLF